MFIAVAIRSHGIIFIGHPDECHGTLAFRMRRELKDKGEDGFVDGDSNFFTREEAARIVYDATGMNTHGEKILIKQAKFME